MRTKKNNSTKPVICIADWIHELYQEKQISHANTQNRLPTR